jgi:hypothetical protein
MRSKGEVDKIECNPRTSSTLYGVRALLCTFRAGAVASVYIQ